MGKKAIERCLGFNIYFNNDIGRYQANRHIIDRTRTIYIGKTTNNAEKKIRAWLEENGYELDEKNKIKFLPFERRVVENENKIKILTKEVNNLKTQIDLLTNIIMLNKSELNKKDD